MIHPKQLHYHSLLVHQKKKTKPNLDTESKKLSKLIWEMEYVLTS